MIERGAAGKGRLFVTEKEALRRQIEHINGRLITLREAAQKDFDRLRITEEQTSTSIFVDASDAHLENLSIGSEIDMFRIVVSGYASQIVGWARIIENVEAAAERLLAYHLFGRLYINKWYLTEAEAYPTMKQYIELVDYLRLLVLQYIRLQEG